MIATVKEHLTGLFNLFYPNICLSCSQTLLSGEKTICFRCENELPDAGHLFDANNRLMQRFWGRIDVQGAAALMQFQKGGNVQHLIHEMKYKGREEVGECIGKIFGPGLKEPESVIKNIDLVVPVPLHWKKLKTRGYNQCDSFAKTIAEVLEVPWSADVVERIHENTSQARRNRHERWENVAGIFRVKNTQFLNNKHVLIVDDIVTTGATAEACMHTIKDAGTDKVSFLAMAMALL